MRNKLIVYDGQFGKFAVNMATRQVIDGLEHDAIWEAANQDYWVQQDIYYDVLEQALYESGFRGYDLVKTDYGAKARIGSEFIEASSIGVTIE
jgi:hypothetical protein